MCLIYQIFLAIFSVLDWPIIRTNVHLFVLIDYLKTTCNQFNGQQSYMKYKLQSVDHYSMHKIYSVQLKLINEKDFNTQIIYIM